MLPAALIASLPRPASPVCAPKPEQWKPVEKQLKTALPKDYKRFIEEYGTGQINEFFYILSPFAKARPMNLLDGGMKLLDAQRTVKSEAPEDVPYPLFPEKGGLLPFGLTDNGDVFYWRTSGAPEAWTIVVNESRGPEYEKFKLSTTKFIERLAAGKLKSEVLPRLEGPPRFEPLAE